MKQGIFEITENTKIAKDVFKMRLAGDTSGITGAGQFVNIKIEIGRAHVLNSSHRT